MASIQERLLAVLDDLGNDDLKRFQWYLQNPVLEKCTPIPKSKMENCSRTDTVAEMIKRYPDEDTVMDLACEVLKKMNINSLVEKLKPGTSGTSSRAVPSSPASLGNSIPSCRDFVKKNKAALETRISNIRPILSYLEQNEVLSLEEREIVESKVTNTEKNAALLAMVIKKGAEDQFYQALKKADPCLVKTLEGKD